MTFLNIYALLIGHTKEVYSVSVTEDDKLIVSGSRDNSIILWSIELKYMIHKYTHHNDSVFGVISVGDFIFSASRDSRIGIVKISAINFES